MIAFNRTMPNQLQQPLALGRHLVACQLFELCLDMYISPCQLVHVVAAKKTWTIATARQHLPEVVGMAAREPQLVYRREKLVAAVVSPELADEAVNLRRPSLATRLAALQRLCAEESYELSAPSRRDRANPLAPHRVRGRVRVRRTSKR